MHPREWWDKIQGRLDRYGPLNSGDLRELSTLYKPSYVRWWDPGKETHVISLQRGLGGSLDKVAELNGLDKSDFVLIAPRPGFAESFVFTPPATWSAEGEEIRGLDESICQFIRQTAGPIVGGAGIFEVGGWNGPGFGGRTGTPRTAIKDDVALGFSRRSTLAADRDWWSGVVYGEPQYQRLWSERLGCHIVGLVDHSQALSDRLRRLSNTIKFKDEDCAPFAEAWAMQHIPGQSFRGEELRSFDALVSKDLRHPNVPANLYFLHSSGLQPGRAWARRSGQHSRLLGPNKQAQGITETQRG